jgi:hypothetical protein
MGLLATIFFLFATVAFYNFYHVLLRFKRFLDVALAGWFFCDGRPFWVSMLVLVVTGLLLLLVYVWRDRERNFPDFAVAVQRLEIATRIQRTFCALAATCSAALAYSSPLVTETLVLNPFGRILLYVITSTVFPETWKPPLSSFAVVLPET